MPVKDSNTFIRGAAVMAKSVPSTSNSIATEKLFSKIGKKTTTLLLMNSEIAVKVV